MTACFPRLRALRGRTELPRPWLLPAAAVWLGLVPFLLLCADFAPLTAMPLAPPTAARPTAAAASEATLSMGPSSLRLQVGGRRGRALSLTIAHRGSPASHPAAVAELMAALATARRGYPQVTTLTLVPHANTPYADVVAMLDLLRGGRSAAAGAPALTPWTDVRLAAASGRP